MEIGLSHEVHAHDHLVAMIVAVFAEQRLFHAALDLGKRQTLAYVDIEHVEDDAGGGYELEAWRRPLLELDEKAALLAHLLRIASLYAAGKDDTRVACIRPDDAAVQMPACPVVDVV